eukprot:gene3331-3608_t
MAKAGTIRGLQVFISDIRACQNKEQESRRVDKELAKIRGKFGDEKKSLTAYDRKKYVWKLLYIYMLGYDVEFGHKQACDLIPAQKYSEKQVGYMACSILMNEKDDFLRLAINGIHNDLVSRNEAFQSLALTFVANIAGQEMAEALTPDVLKLLTSGTARPVVRKKAALCLLRLLRKTPADAQLVSAETFAPIMGRLLEEHDLGLLLSSVTLLLGLCSRAGSGAGYEQCHAKLLRLLERLVYLKDVTPDYTYYGIASPWLQTKVLRTLQYFPAPEGAAAQKQLHDVLQLIFNACGDSVKASTINKSNAQHAILFEAISLILALDCSRELLNSSVTTLGKFLSVKEPNIRYLALENLTRLALVPEVLESIQAHQATVLSNLKDPDVSIRRRALDLLFTMCDGGAAVEVVEQLVAYLTVADFSMREELVLKIAILAEKFAPNVQWYVDVVLGLLERAGDFCSDDIWHRVVQLITNNEGSQVYAAGQVVEVLNRGAGHEALMCMAAYVLGEYGRLIKGQVGSLEQFRLLHDRFPTQSSSTKGLLLSAFLKILLSDPGNAPLQAEVKDVFTRYSRQLDPELQQRSAEYLVLAQDPANATQHYVLPMPKWEGRESALLKRLAATEGNDADATDASPPAAVDEGLTLPAGSINSSLSTALAGTAEAAGQAGPGATRSLGAPSATAPAAQAASAAAAPVAKAPEIDLLGDDLVYANGNSTPAALATAAAPAAPPAPEPPVAAAAAAPTKAIDPLDELFMSPAVPAAPPAAAAGQHSYGVGVAAVGAAAAPGGLAGVGSDDWRLMGDVQQWHRALLVKDKGILYEDTFLQIGLQSRYSGSRGELLLFLGNKQASQPVTGLQLVLGAPGSALQVEVGQLPAQLAPKQQVQVPVQVTCLQPFLEAPRLLLRYVSGSMRQVAQELLLPLAPHKFMVPQPHIAKEAFFDKWKSYRGPPLKQQQMLERTTPLAVETTLLIIRGLNFGVEHLYLDPSPNNEAGAALFTSGRPGAEKALLCQFRVTVAAPDGLLAASLKDMLVAQLTAAV